MESPLRNCSRLTANADLRGNGYLNHPVLETRLRECTGLINAVEGRSIEQILGK